MLEVAARPSSNSASSDLKKTPNENRMPMKVLVMTREAATTIHP
jgi:hypothetical protein